MNNNYTMELRNAVEQIIMILQQSSRKEDHELCVTRLEILCENALANDDIPIQIVDILNQAKIFLQNNIHTEREFNSYEAPLERQQRRGRPRFVISEEQLRFFTGKYILWIHYSHTS